MSILNSYFVKLKTWLKNTVDFKEFTYKTNHGTHTLDKTGYKDLLSELKSNSLKIIELAVFNSLDIA